MPLTSDLDGLAKASSDWVGRATSPDDLAELGNIAWQQANARSGQIASFDSAMIVRGKIQALQCQIHYHLLILMK